MRPRVETTSENFWRKLPVSKPVAILLFLVLLWLGVWLTKDAVLNGLVTKAIRSATGLEVRMSYLHVHLVEPRAEVKDLLVLNPEGFREPVMADVPLILVDYDRGSLLSSATHLYRLRLDLRELIVERGPSGGLNVEAIPVIQAEKWSSGTPSTKQAIRVDTLELHIGRVLYKDYSKAGTPETQKFTVNLHEQYRDVTDPQALMALIIAKALMNTAVPELAHLDVESLKRQAGEALGTAVTVIEDVTKRALRKPSSP